MILNTNDFKGLAEGLAIVGIGSYPQEPDMLVVSNENPAWPGSNSFWVRKKDQVWLIGTWAPAIYRILPDQNIAKICEAVFRSSSTAIYTIGESMVEEFKLDRLTDEEMESLG